MELRKVGSRWLVVLAFVAVSVAMTSRVNVPPVSAQQAPATEVKIFVPWQPNGMLNPSIVVRSREPLMGNPNLASDCQSGSIADQRPDAWRCVTADPCFAPLFGDRMTVACSNAPWSNEVVLLQLSRPLPTPQECSAMMGACPRPLDLNSPPWAIELANGARCTASTGTISSVAGIGLVYGCDDGGQIGVADRNGPFDKSLPQWRALYLPKDGTVMSQVGVLTVWY